MMMTRRIACVLVSTLAASGAIGCGNGDDSPAPAPSGYSFSGRVYDGATGQRITAYTASLQYRDVTLNANVNATSGLYYVGSVPPGNDYTVEIDAMGYRSFLSHNQELPSGYVSYYYDAYLFPTSLQSPAATFTITSADTGSPIAGNITLRPTGSSSLYAAAADQPAGVLDQVWSNDDDLQFRAVSKAFTNGTVSFNPGDLVYGVTYDVTVYGATGLQPGTGTFQSGVDSALSLQLERQVVPGLQAAFINNTPGQLVGDGSLEIAFNEAIEIDPLEDQTTIAPQLDAALSIDSPDKDNNGTKNTLKTASPTVSLGTTFSVNGNVLTIKWSPTTALATVDAMDPIVSVTYGNLDAIRIRPVNGEESDTTTVASVIGTGSETIDVALP